MHSRRGCSETLWAKARDIPTDARPVWQGGWVCCGYFKLRIAARLLRRAARFGVTALPFHCTW